MRENDARLARGWPHDVPAIRRVRTGDSDGDGRLRWSWWADSLRNINPDCYAPSRSPNQFYLARVIASDVLDQLDE